MSASSSSSAAPSASASLSPGQSPPLFTVTATDQGGVIVIVTAFCLALAIIATLVRAYVRFKITGQRLAWDDGVIGAAVVRSLLRRHELCVQLTYRQRYSISSRLSWSSTKSTTVSERQSIKLMMKTYLTYNRYQVQWNLLRGLSNVHAQFLYADGFFYILAIWVSKISTTFLYLRLSRKRDHRWMNFAVIFVLALTCFVSILVTALRCDLSRPWAYFNAEGTFCSDLVRVALLKLAG